MSTDTPEKSVVGVIRRDLLIVVALVVAVLACVGCPSDSNGPVSYCCALNEICLSTCCVPENEYTEMLHDAALAGNEAGCEYHWEGLSLTCGFATEEDKQAALDACD
jgi:hypothetical protein